MPQLVFGFLLLSLLYNCVSSKQSRLEEDVRGNLGEMIFMAEKLNGLDKKVEQLLQKMERMENKIGAKNLEADNLQKQIKELQKKNKKQELTHSEMIMQCKAEVKKEVEKVLSPAIEEGLRDFGFERGLRDLPFEMVCAYKHEWDEVGVVSYDRITMEFNNSDRPGGADGTMNIETGVFTTVTSGYYIVTFSAYVQVNAAAGEFTRMYLRHNGVEVEESRFFTRMHFGNSADDYIIDQASRTVVWFKLLFSQI